MERKIQKGIIQTHSNSSQYKTTMLPPSLMILTRDALPSDVLNWLSDTNIMALSRIFVVRMILHRKKKCVH